MVSLLYIVCLLSVSSMVIAMDPDVYLNSTQLIEARGFPAEEHIVETPDHYFLKMFRIPHGRNSDVVGPPVLVMHALLCSSDEFLVDFEDESLGYVLADAGFDVWLANKRGNTYSNTHRYLTVNDDAFWEFTFDDVGIYDIPTEIDYILATTGYSSLGYVGHSEGTTAGFIAALQESTQGKINSMALLAPVGNVTNVQNNKLLTDLSKIGADGIPVVFGKKDFLAQTPLLKNYGPVFCHICDSCCKAILEFFCGFGGDPNLFNTSRFEVYYSHTPSGTSTENMVHWVQGLSSHRFQMYDYGTSGNQEHYKMDTPPEYDISKIKVPIALFSGLQDTLATPETVAALIAQLPATTTLNVQPAFEHMAFAWSPQAAKLIYPLVLEHLKSHLP